MKRIYKYTLPERSEFIFSTPEGAQIAKISCQFSDCGGGLMMWAIVDPLKPMVERRFSALLTGATVADNLEYIATVEKPDGIILHFFEHK